MAASFLDVSYLIFQKRSRQSNTLEDNGQSRLAIYDTYEQVYSETNNTFKALQYAEMGRGLADSIFRADQAQILQNLDIKYETSKKEAANQILSKDNTIKQRNLVFSFIALGLVALLGAISFNSYRQKQKANTILTQQRNQVQQLASELDVANQTKARLFSTIGHDLRAPVSSLYAMLKMQEIKGVANTGEATAMSSHTIALLNTLEDLLIWSKTQMDRFVPMPVAVYMDELYEEMMAIFTGGAIAKTVTLIRETMPGLVLYCDENIVRIMLRNIISNALTHAPAGTSVLLTAAATDRTTMCSVKNQCSSENFESFKLSFENAGVQSSSHGLGLVLIKEFAAKINATISLGYNEGWVTVSVILPIKT